MQLEGCIEEIRGWMCTNNLKLNDNKTEFMVMGSKSRLSTVGDVEIKIGSDTITASSSTRNIRAMFDSTMEMKVQVNQITRSCYCHLRAISHIRKYLTTEAAEKLVHAFVTSRLDNNNSLLYGISDYVLHKLQLIQNHAARLITKKKKSDHITSTLISLHWLPIRARIQYKILLLAYKSQNNVAPVYLADLLKPYISGRTGSRSEDKKLLYQPSCKYDRYGGRAFSVCAPKLWNLLPYELKTADSLDIFKGLLKTYLFKQAYSV